MQQVNGDTLVHPEGISIADPELAMLEILLVEDDEADAYLIAEALAEHPRVGNIIRAKDGVEALDLLTEGGLEPALAIIDLHMPRKNGFNLLLELTCAGRQFPMIVLTSSTAKSDAIRSRLRGASRVLAKPDTVEELRDLLDDVIRVL